MTSTDSVVPDHLDISRALSATLATHRGQLDVLPLLAAQCVTAADVDRFIMALLSAFAAHVARKVEDPESYLLQWIALEQELDAAEKAVGDGSLESKDSDDSGDTDVN
jgi:hypothetical protein